MGMYFSIVLFCFIVVVSLSSGCGGGSSGGSGDISKSIGPDGGILEVTDVNSAVYGVRLDIPAGALAEDTAITISRTDAPTHLPGNFSIAGVSVQLSPPGLAFLSPITLTLPYADQDDDGLVDGTSSAENLVTALFADEENESWEPFEITEQDIDANLVSIQTDHFSTYLSVLDATTSDDSTDDPAATTFISGEHLFANPSFTYSADGTPTIIRLQAPYYHLTVIRKVSQNGLVSVLDRFITLEGIGAECVMADDFLSCTFNAQTVFSKVAQSGDAALWDWNCEFNDEHTHLQTYEVHDDALATEATDSTGRVLCSVTALDASSVTITWGINADEEVLYFNTDMLAIRMWANFK